MSEGAVPVSRQTLRRCIRSAKDLLTSEVRWRAITLAALLVGFLLASGVDAVHSREWVKDHPGRTASPIRPPAPRPGSATLPAVTPPG
jgi:hypothetical protein